MTRARSTADPANHPGVTGVIPARWASSRFPGKPLHPIAGRPLLQHVWERCARCSRLDRLVVATDDQRIADAATGFGAEVVMTSPDHPSGTDRVAEAITHLGSPAPAAVVNIQGDEPLIDPALVDRLAGALADDPDLGMVTAAHPVTDPSLAHDPNVVKVVTGTGGDALYFSRSPIPHGPGSGSDGGWLRHEGIYGYRREVLEAIVRWKPTPLEKRERLEQLRALEHGVRIRVLISAGGAVGVDTPDQVQLVEPLILQELESAGTPAAASRGATPDR